MARQKRRYAGPLVITLAAATASACGVDGENSDRRSSKTGDGDGDGAGATGGTSNPPTLTGGTASGGAPLECGVDLACNPPPPNLGGGGSGGGTGLPVCDEDDLRGYNGDCTIGATCVVETTCTSQQEKDFIFACVGDDEETWWQKSELPLCSGPHEECRNNAGSGWFGCNENWGSLADPELNPPAPCPLEQPEDGDPCWLGDLDGFGADAMSCGYSCENGAWTVTGCSASLDDPTVGEWESDGACSGPLPMGGAPSN